MLACALEVDGSYWLRSGRPWLDSDLDPGDGDWLEYGSIDSRSTVVSSVNA